MTCSVVFAHVLIQRAALHLSAANERYWIRASPPSVQLLMRIYHRPLVFFFGGPPSGQRVMHLSKMLIPCKCRFTAPQQNVQLLLAFQQPTGSEKTMTINSLQDAVVQRRSLIKCECLPKSWSQLNVGSRAIRFGVCENFPADGTCGNRQTKPEFERERGGQVVSCRV